MKTGILDKALTFASETGRRPFVCVIPFDAELAKVRALAAFENVRTVILPEKPESATKDDTEVGIIHENDMVSALPFSPACDLLFAGPLHDVGFRVMMGALGKGIIRIHFWSIEGWRNGFLPWLALNRLLHWFGENVHRWRWRVGMATPKRHAPKTSPARRQYRLLLDEQSFPLLPAEAFTRDRILMLTGSLGRGGYGTTSRQHP